MRLLFLCGHHYVGKTTLAHALQERGDYVKESLSDGLRCLCLERLRDEGHVFDSSIFLEAKDKPWIYPGMATPRDYLKKVGMEMRAINQTWLAEALEKRISTHPLATKVVIDDWRFPHEIQWFIDRGYSVHAIRIVRPETHPSLAEIEARGVTEAFIDTLEVDEIFLNDGSLDELRGLGVLGAIMDSH